MTNSAHHLITIESKRVLDVNGDFTTVAIVRAPGRTASTILDPAPAVVACLREIGEAVTIWDRTGTITRKSLQDAAAR